MLQKCSNLILSNTMLTDIPSLPWGLTHGGARFFSFMDTGGQGNKVARPVYPIPLVGNWVIGVRNLTLMFIGVVALSRYN